MCINTHIHAHLQVFCDNYLDGGYHVPFAHKGLASGLKLDSYSTMVFSLAVFLSLESKFKFFAVVP